MIEKALSVLVGAERSGMIATGDARGAVVNLGRNSLIGYESVLIRGGLGVVWWNVYEYQSVCRLGGWQVRKVQV